MRDVMDWSTVFLSAAVSTLVGTMVSLAAVSQVTVRQRRADRKDQSIQRLRSLTSPLLADLRKYEIGLSTSLRRDAERADAQDHVTASQLLDASENLPWLRRRLAKRRCVTIFGRYWTQLAEDLPDSGDGNAAVAAFLVSGHLTEKGNLTGSPVTSLIHRAYMTEPGSPELNALRRQLAWLARGF